MNDNIFCPHLDGFEGTQKQSLEHLYNLFSRFTPGGVWGLAWGMPTIRVDGDVLISFNGFSSHNTIFPGDKVVSALSSSLDGFQLSKGAIKLARDYFLKAPLARKLITESINVLNSSYPRANGSHKEFYKNGYLKSKGRYSKGEMHGHWQFFRQDGSLMREGSFKHGVKLEDWVTHLRPQ